MAGQALAREPPQEELSLIDCSKVEARPDAWGGVGVFATERIRKGELVERGVVQRLPVDGWLGARVLAWKTRVERFNLRRFASYGA